MKLNGSLHTGVKAFHAMDRSDAWIISKSQNEGVKKGEKEGSKKEGNCRYSSRIVVK